MAQVDQRWRCLPALALLAGLTVRAPAAEPSAFEIPPPRPTLSDAENFFIEYQRAAGFVNRGATAEATLVLEALRHRLTTSPWLEITLLKRNELMEWRNPRQALEGYQLILGQRLAETYYHTETAGLLRQAVRAAAERGVRRVRLRRVDDALGRFFVRNQRYPESLAMLVTHQLLAPDDLLDPRQRPFRYTSQALALAPHRARAYDLERVPREPFAVTSPRLRSTTKLSDDPVRYAALLQTSPRKDPAQIVAGQTLDGYFIAAIGARGVIVCTQDRVLILPIPR